MSRKILHNQSGLSYSAPVLARPLGGTPTMTNYRVGKQHTWPGDQKFSSMHRGAFDGTYIWFTGTNENINLYRLHVADGTIQEFSPENGINGNTGMEEISSICSIIVFDGTSIWLFPPTGRTAVQVNPETGTMTGHAIEEGVNGTNLPETFQNAKHVIFDGKYIWFPCSKLIRFDPVTITMTGYPPSHFANTLAYDGRYIWSGAHSVLMRFDPETQESTLYEYDYPSTNTHALVWDGRYIWSIPNVGNQMVKRFDPVTEKFKSFSMIEGSNGNTNMGNTNSTSSYTYFGALFDGKYIWIAPMYANRILRLDPQTGSMQGFNTDHSLQPASYAKDIVFDGNHVWLVSHAAPDTIKLTGAYTFMGITEQYVNESGRSLQEESFTWAQEGKPWSSSALTLEDAAYIGYRLDGGDLQYESTVSISSADEDHVITYVYDKELILPPEDLKLYILLQQQETIDLIAHLLPSGLEGTDAQWSSNNTDVAMVDAAGMVTGLAPGDCTITVKSADGSLEAKARIMVVQKGDTELRLSIHLQPEQTCRLIGVLFPEDSNAPLTWKSSNTAVATVSISGEVTAHDTGFSLITVTDGTLTDSIHVYVCLK